MGREMVDQLRKRWNTNTGLPYYGVRQEIGFMRTMMEKRPSLEERIEFTRKYMRATRLRVNWGKIDKKRLIFWIRYRLCIQHIKEWEQSTGRLFMAKPGSWYEVYCRTVGRLASIRAKARDSTSTMQ